jgi:hypothetical protein
MESPLGWVKGEGAQQTAGFIYIINPLTLTGKLLYAFPGWMIRTER